MHLFVTPWDDEEFFDSYNSYLYMLRISKSARFSLSFSFLNNILPHLQHGWSLFISSLLCVRPFNYFPFFLRKSISTTVKRKMITLTNLWIGVSGGGRMEVFPVMDALEGLDGIIPPWRIKVSGHFIFFGNVLRNSIDLGSRSRAALGLSATYIIFLTCQKSRPPIHKSRPPCQKSRSPCCKSRPPCQKLRLSCSKSRPPCCESRMCLRMNGLQGGLDLLQVGKYFQEVGKCSSI